MLFIYFVPNFIAFLLLFVPGRMIEEKCLSHAEFVGSYFIILYVPTAFKCFFYIVSEILKMHFFMFINGKSFQSICVYEIKNNVL